MRVGEKGTHIDASNNATNVSIEHNYHYHSLFQTLFVGHGFYEAKKTR